jgi:hypothetical protein
MKRAGYTTIALLVAAAALLMPSAATAAVFEAAPRISVPYEQTVSSNLYFTGGTVLLQGATEGDVVGLASALVIDGTVQEDVTTLAATAQLAGVTDGDVRVAAGDVRISGRVAGDLLVLGGTVDVMPGAAIAGDTVILGGDVTVDGSLGEQTTVYGGTVSFNGASSGDVVLRGTGEVTLGEATNIGGSLTYHAPEKQALPQAAHVSGDITFRATDTIAPLGSSLLSIAFALELLALALATVLLVQLLPSLAQRIGGEGVPHFGWNLLYGVLLVVCAPLLIIALFATIVGLYLALVAAALYVLLLVTATLASGVLVGALIARAVLETVHVNWKWTLLGIVVLAVVSLIPIIGWAAAAIVYFASAGTIARVSIMAARSSVQR